MNLLFNERLLIFHGYNIDENCNRTMVQSCVFM